MKAHPAVRGFAKARRLPFTADGVTVTAATAGAGFEFAAPSRSNTTHRIGRLAVAWFPDGPRLMGQWLCEATAANVTLYTPEMAGLLGACTGCEQIAQSGGVIGPCVYRVYTAERERLLYIGATKNWPQRRRQHRSRTWWWMGLAREVDLTGYPTIDEALTAEAEAIRAERPAMNVQHNLRAVS